ncbi:DUF6922 domain-containing protein [Niabella ginsengisoli]|uniref:DUF6922 domain-containing protein n=1 Tax=Niabella ginsengisoli TaxID=522298 RepID=A0ABS9SI78_9BACT|nr:hypothetical protein [Niabella ginsengisoli]MCH5598050.1 hypothetical protein [Niabella ginsengisoli]
MNERRGITPYLSIKLAKQFNTANDYFMILQGYEVKKVSDKLEKATPDLAWFRKVLFWDTDIYKLDWQKNRQSKIKRTLF